MKKDDTYFYCGCKSWNLDDFEALIKEDFESEWVFIRTPAELLEGLRIQNPRCIFFVHWSWVVPADIYCNYECICFHMTDVPYGRGGSPLQNLIVARKTETVITALRMTGAVDAGPVYIKRPMSLEGRAEDIYRRASAISLDMMREIVERKPVAIAQEGKVTIFKRRTPEQSIMPNDCTISELYDHIRMLDAPTYPHALLRQGNFSYHFSNARIEGDGITATVRITKVEGDLNE